MNAQARIGALDAELVEIEAEIEALTEKHAAAVQAGDDDKADRLHGEIREARLRQGGAQARRKPLEGVREAEREAERDKEAEALTRDADARLEALEAKIAEASEAAAKLAAICDDLDQSAALRWATAARKAVEAGGSPQRRYLTGLGELLDNANRAGRKLRYVANDYAQRSPTVAAAKPRPAEVAI